VRLPAKYHYHSRIMLNIVLDNAEVMYLEIPGIDEIHEGSFVEVTKHADVWDYVVTDNGCDMEISRGSCNPDLRALYSALANPE